MATIWKKAISILARNLNSGRSYRITAVLLALLIFQTFIRPCTFQTRQKLHQPSNHVKCNVRIFPWCSSTYEFVCSTYGGVASARRAARHRCGARQWHTVACCWPIIGYVRRRQRHGGSGSSDHCADRTTLGPAGPRQAIFPRFLQVQSTTWCWGADFHRI